MRSRREQIVAAILVMLALLRAAAFAYSMIPASLSHDELLSITKYSAGGTLFSLTHYDEPNNHILFNALNGAFPGRGSAFPPRAKALSILAVALMLGAVCAFFWRRGLAIEGAALVALLSTDRITLGLWLSARGYGMQALFAALATMSFLAWRETGRLRYLVTLSCVCVLGIWTVPTFLLFAAPLLAFVFVLKPSWSTASASLGAAIATVLVHVPVLKAMHVALNRYGEEWGRDYASPSAVAMVVKLGLLPEMAPRIPDGVVWVAFIVLIGAVGWAARAGSNLARSCLTLFGAVAFFFGACLLLQSPVLRSTAFIIVPLGAAIVLSIGELIRRVSAPMRGRIWRGAAIAAVLALCVRPPWGERFEPEEHWKEVAEAIESNFPDGTTLFPTLGSLDRPEPRWGDFLHAHMLRPDAFPVSRAFDREAFLAGRMIVHERPYRESEHLSVSALPKEAISIRFPQSHVGYQALWLVPPISSPHGRSRAGALPADEGPRALP